MSTPCPPQEQLERLLDDCLEAIEDAALARHVESCAECQDKLERLVAGSLSTPGPAQATPEMSDALLLRLKKRGRRPDETAKLPATQPLANGPSNETVSLPEVPGYEVLREIGRGGMGVVYRARQLGANRLVALKMIRAVEHASPAERLRFQIETEAVARLQHPHIVQLYEAGEVRGQPFFSLELCDGGTLSDQLKKQRPTPQEAAALIETLARAMHYAHLRGVVHRDLKPGNVLLAASADLSVGETTSQNLVPKITDFGLAKRIDAEAREVSQSGTIMGTAAYMAPEQAAGKVRDTGPAADVYALGALLYECLTGRPPFAGPHHVVLLSVLAEEPVPPSRVGRKVLPEQGAGAALRQCRGTGQRLAALPGGRADPGAAGGRAGARGEVGAEAADAGRAPGRGAAGAGGAGRALRQPGGGSRRRRGETEGRSGEGSGCPAGSRQDEEGARLPGEHFQPF
jgi:eukaryotic-like serine/threonine-protein kinase